MSLKIDKARIESGDLTEAEYRYLRQRNRLPLHMLERGLPLEEQSVPTIGEPGGIVNDPDAEQDYLEGWNNDQRRTELARRKLSVNGSKDELIARLRRSDTGQLTDDDYSKLED